MKVPRWLWVLVLASLGGMAPLGADSLSLPLATGEWDPYTGEALPNQGIAVEILTQACQAAGLELRVQFYPWTRALLLAKVGQVFAAFPYIPTEERAKDFLFSSPFVANTYSVVSFRDNPETRNFRYQSVEDLKGLRIAKVASGVYPELVKAGVLLEDRETVDALVLALKADRVQLIVEDQLAIRHSIRRVFPQWEDRFVFSDKPYRTYQMGLLVSRTYPEAAALLAQFETGLAAIRKNGVLAAIERREGISF